MSATITVSATDGSANALAYAIGARRRDIEERVAVAERRGAAAVVREYLREDASNLKEFPGSSCTPCGVARVTAPLIARSERV